ncbi:cupin domain-containing protein [Breznakia pachnodae]|uniref:Cupin superfamily protein n=1 Tax=Breznakia pachnodae TaxID=265178 RepID=A0ABU0E6F0_9FIRM|nr:cupin domain-containing protein [Breznakia pachnodae]MDQ0362396.1 putative cupin superfamily protein [Breznakia pachnodae]
MTKTIIVNENDVERVHRKPHEKYEYYKRQITSRDQFDQLYVSIYDIPPLKASYPFHYHVNNTEAFYIISGQGLFIGDGEENIIRKGDVIVCPQGKEGVHKIVNTSETQMLTYIDIDSTNSPDIVHYPDSKKINVIVHGESADVYMEEDTVDYFTGE